MVSKAQLRILAWLNRYPDSLTTAWDVTREISQPGIAEGLGVVRSALNLPLSALQQSGLITKRTAHVIGGGNRRRQVYHLSPEGRSYVQKNNIDLIKPKPQNKILGSPPVISEIFGRDTERQQCEQLLEENSLLITGMPGIGKSAFVHSLCVELGKQISVRWAVANQFSDYYTIVNDWYPDESFPLDISAISAKLQDSQSILVIDDINLVSDRHITKLKTLLENLIAQSSLRLILISRDSSKILDNLANFTLDQLDLSACCEMLGENIDLSKRQLIAKSLGQHPLALKLHQPEYNAPESSSTVIQYVEDVVLSGLTETQRNQILPLSLEVKPLLPKYSFIADDLAYYDDLNLVRWNLDNRFELQHLIRNVISNNMSKETKLGLHELLAQHWAGQTAPGAFENYLYHLSKSDIPNFVTQLGNVLSGNMNFDTAALAMIVNESIMDNGISPQLAYIESQIAAYRYEPSIIRANLAHLSDEQLIELEFVLAQMEGRLSDCEAMLPKYINQKSHSESAKMLISLANRILEDRFPNQSVNSSTIDKVEDYLQQIELKNIRQGRQSLVVAISAIRHSIAIANQNFSAGAEIVTNLEAVGSVDDAIIVQLKSKTAIAKYSAGQESVDRVRELVESSCYQINHPLIANSLKLRLAEALLDTKVELAKGYFADLTLPTKFARSSAAIRYSARWWLLHSQLFPASRRASMLEAIVRFREAGCVTVAGELERRIHAEG
tara:strand:+ start:5775 stop:7955 length:2181 start_codon:yes stop_codon:yes gene_type:complete